MGGYLILSVPHTSQHGIKSIFRERLFVSAKGWESQFVILIEGPNGPEDCKRLPRERHVMRSTHFHPLCRDAPQPFLKINLFPFHVANVTGAGHRQDEELKS
jgi:hypothetical protein